MKAKKSVHFQSNLEPNCVDRQFMVNSSGKIKRESDTQNELIDESTYDLRPKMSVQDYFHIKHSTQIEWAAVKKGVFRGAHPQSPI